MNRLLNIGFEKVGEWKPVGGKIEHNLVSHKNTPNILYAFIHNNEVKYIGVTTKVLSDRMDQYQNSHTSQKTNDKISKKIKTLLLAKNTVDIFILPDNRLLYFRGYYLDIAAGLEKSLIREYPHSWNNQNKLLHSDVSNSKLKKIIYKIINFYKSTS